LPQFCFTMVGGPGGSDSSSINYFRAIEAAAKSIPNLRFHGFVPYSEVDSYFDRARVFVNTSLYEGFPNTFLQSWARGVPVVSYFDTGSRHNKDAVVRVVADEPAAAIQISTLMSNARDWRTASQRSLEHFSDVHSVDSAVSRYARLFSRMGIVPALA
jgi:glycosyltransferase involved in cell wall biosynthesis